jgi:hypothetical protein
VWIKKEPVSLFGISSKPEKRQRIKNKKKEIIFNSLFRDGEEK